jgi:hypothetical protein
MQCIYTKICLIFLFFIVLIFIYIHRKYIFNQKKIIETFQDDSFIELDQEDKEVYFSIIDKYQLLLDRDPYDDEIQYAYTSIKNKTMVIEDIDLKIKDSQEYKRFTNVQDNMYAPTTVSNHIQDNNEVMSILRSLMPNVDDSQYDSAYLEFMIMKYKGFDKNKDKFKSYVKNTPEYSDYTNKSDIVSGVVENASDVVENVSGVVENVSGVITEKTVDITDNIYNYSFKRPELSSSTMMVSKLITQQLKDNPSDESGIDQEDTCGFYNEFIKNKTLSERQNQRNLEQLQYSCEMSKYYKNMNKDMTLVDGQKWSVPQKITPVCTSYECQVHDTTDQSSLIGTLLSDIDDQKIMPNFDYKEKV